MLLGCLGDAGVEIGDKSLHSLGVLTMTFGGVGGSGIDYHFGSLQV
jgi:hypothetical protein